MQNDAGSVRTVEASSQVSRTMTDRETDLEAPDQSSEGWYKQWWRRSSGFGRVGSESSFGRRHTVFAPQAPARFAWDGVETITDAITKGLDKMNAWGDRSWIGRFFTFRERQARLGKELHAGLISFLMIVYTLTVNPTILGTTGGTCDAEELCEPMLYDLFKQQCLYVSSKPDAIDCLLSFKRSVTTATAVASLISSFSMGFFANLPMGLAPGIGINVYFAYQVVGQDVLTYEQALVAVFIEGWIFIILSLTGVRGAIMKYMPTSIAFSGSVGMGLLLAYTGLISLGAIAFDRTTLTTLGGCPPEYQQYVYYSNVSLADTVLAMNRTNDVSLEAMGDSLITFQGRSTNISVESFNQAAPNVYACASHEMQSATMWLGIAGGIISSLLLVWRVRGALFIGVAFVTIIAWIPGHAASYLGEGSPIPGGQLRLQNFEQVVAAPSLSESGLKWDWSAVGTGNFWFVLFTFLYIDILDCTGILLSMALLLDSTLELDYYGVDDHDEIREKKEAIKEANDGVEPNPYQQFVSQNKEFKGQQWAFLSDGMGIIVSSMVGISPVNVYLENAAGIEEGGRTGIVPLVVSFLFFISLFFSPILSSIPSYATGAALLLVGIMLMAHADHIPWDEPKESIPAFLTIIVMPLTYSVAYGILGGICMWIILRLPEWGAELYQRARHRIRGDQMMDDAVSIASSKKSGKGGRGPVRKFFGNVSNRGSDMDSLSNLGMGSEPFAGRERGLTSDSIPIPGGRQLSHSQSHAAFSPSWDAGNGGLGGAWGAGMSSSPGRDMLSSPSNRPVWGRTTSGTEMMAMPPRRSQTPALQFPTLKNSLKKSASFAVLNQEVNTSTASVDGESGGGLFGDFQLLDLDLGGSGSSEDEQEIMLENDGTLSLVSRKSLQRQSADMSMFGRPQEGTLDMGTIPEPPAPGQVAHVSENIEGSVHADRRITFSIQDEDDATLGATDAVGQQRSLSRQVTNRSMASNASKSSGGLSRSLSQSGSFVGRGMVRTESAAALRLKDLFAAAPPDSDSDSTPRVDEDKQKN